MLKTIYGRNYISCMGRDSTKLFYQPPRLKRDFIQKKTAAPKAFFQGAYERRDFALSSMSLILLRANTNILLCKCLFLSAIIAED